MLPVEEYRERESAPAFYMPPTMYGSRPGQYYLNTYQPDQRQLHKIAAITFHEATPGHHFQIAIEMDLEGLGRFRTLGAKMAGSAYVEGWGLYSERLADEMGLYRSEGERFGMLDGQAWRAARLVVDTGLHALRWERQRSIDFLRDDAGLSETDAVIRSSCARHIGALLAGSDLLVAHPRTIKQAVTASPMDRKLMEHTIQCLPCIES